MILKNESTEENVADVFTKYVSEARMNKIVEKLGTSFEAEPLVEG